MESILALKAESIDIGFKVTVILAVPGLDGEARELARAYGMHVLEARSLNTLNEKIEEFLEKVMKSVGSSSSMGSGKEKLKGE